MTTRFPRLPRTIRTKSIIMLGACALAGCVGTPGPSVPFKAGHDLSAARFAVHSCAEGAAEGGKGLVAGSYIAGVVLGGLVLGPVYVASNQPNIRANGEAWAVDDCLKDQGFTRRNLTAAEVQAINASAGHERHLLLSHLIGGGALAMFGHQS